MALWPGANRLSTPHGGGMLVRPTFRIRTFALPTGLCALFHELAHFTTPFTEHCFTSPPRLLLAKPAPGRGRLRSLPRHDRWAPFGSGSSGHHFPRFLSPPRGARGGAPMCFDAEHAARIVYPPVRRSNVPSVLAPHPAVGACVADGLRKSPAEEAPALMPLDRCVFKEPAPLSPDRRAVALGTSCYSHCSTLRLSATNSYAASRDVWG